ncbi:MAG: GspL/Epsl periplasmic domain-containing protein [Planctomycetota bacterium]|jgi:Tfp pilus assembly PilM family ATPase/Tfp pilus assembly protein PilN
MVRRCIGIDIGPSHVRAAQIACTGEKFLVEKVFSTQTRRTTDSRPDILRSLTERHGFDRRAEVAVSMPAEDVFFRTFQTDAAGSEQVPAEHLSELERDFPIPPDQNVTRVCSQAKLSEHKHCVLLAAVSRASLRERLDLLAAARMRPNCLEPAVFAIHSVVAVNHPEIRSGPAIIAGISASRLMLAVTKDGAVLIVRNIPLAAESDDDVRLVNCEIADLLAAEAAITWQRIFGGDIDPNTTVYLVTEGGSLNGLQTDVGERLQCRVTLLEQRAKVKSPARQNGDGPSCIAEGLALSALGAGESIRVNFLEAENLETVPKLNLKKEFVTCAVLAAVIAVVSLVGLFTRLARLEARYAQTKSQIKETFRSALPEETNIVNPLAQLDQKLQSLRANPALFGYICGAGDGPLEILNTVTNTVPAQANINIGNLWITAESVRLTGTAPSFDSISNWRSRLQKIPGFSTVEANELRRESASGLVRFTILISLSPPE